MGDPSRECEIEEDTCYYSPQVNRNGKVSWLLNKGWGIGKKILVTGAVISSAPFVLPPLVVTSAIAFACWVPSGVVLASYACSEKLMSKLLPYSSSSSSSTTEIVLMSNNEEEEFEYAEEGVEADVGEHLDVEEKPKWEGIKIEGSRDEYKDNVLLDENNAVSDGVDVLVFNVIEGEEEFGVTPIEVTSTVVLEGSEGQEKVSDFVEEEELVKETRGLLEKFRDEGNANNAGAMEKRYAGEIEQREEETDELIGSHVEETEGAVENKTTDADVGLEKPTGETEDGVPKESEEIEEMKHVRDANAVSEDRASVSESKSADKTFGAEKPIEEIKIVNNILEAEMLMAETRIGVSTIVEEKHAPGINKEAVLQARRAEHNIKENVVSTNADAREIADESGLHLFDEKNVSGQQDWHSFDYNISVSEGHVGEEGADFAELPISSRADESTDARISSGKDDIHSNGVLKNEDKIWEQIDAMRSIIGYRGTPHESCIEELKALYIFTGVEPPTSFNDDPPDLAQVIDKLRFLMSIIGLQ